jgi:hypothetical protein
MEYIQSAEPIKVNGPVVASYGSEWLSCKAVAAAAPAAAAIPVLNVVLCLSNMPCIDTAAATQLQRCMQTILRDK